MTKEEFDKKFWELWYENLTEADTKVMYLNPHASLIVPKKTPRQNPDEFREFLWLVSGRPGRVVVEIGKGHGQTAKFYRKLLAAMHYISVDKNPALSPAVCGDSTDQETIDKVGKALMGFGVDVLFIDGFHSEEVVRKDFENYKQFVVPGGYIALHDTHQTHSPGRSDGAAILWGEIKNAYPSWDIHYHIDWHVAERKDGTKIGKQMGIGVIQV